MFTSFQPKRKLQKTTKIHSLVTYGVNIIGSAQFISHVDDDLSFFTENLHMWKKDLIVFVSLLKI